MVYYFSLVVGRSNGKQKYKNGLVDTLCALPKPHIYLWLLLGHIRHIEISGIIFIANIHTQSQSVDLPDLSEVTGGRVVGSVGSVKVSRNKPKIGILLFTCSRP